MHDIHMGRTDDRAVWVHARDHGFVIVTKAADFTDLAAAWGHPSKIVWVRLGNCTTSRIEAIIRSESESLSQFNSDSGLGVLVLG